MAFVYLRFGGGGFIGVKAPIFEASIGVLVLVLGFGGLEGVLKPPFGVLKPFEALQAVSLEVVKPLGCSNDLSGFERFVKNAFKSQLSKGIG